MVARRVELRRCRLTGAELAEAVLSDVTFVECRLDLVGLRIAKLERVVFRDCRMAECDFYEASLTDVLFEHCELREGTPTVNLHRGTCATRWSIPTCTCRAVRSKFHQFISMPGRWPRFRRLYSSEQRPFAH
jgi:hypothetical protein